MKISILKPFNYKSDDDGFGLFGGVTTLFRHHLIPMLKENGIKIQTIDKAKDLYGDTLLIPSVNKYLTEESQPLNTIAKAKARGMKIACLLHGDNTEMARVLRQLDFCKQVDNFGYIGRDTTYPRKVIGKDCFHVTHPYYRFLEFKRPLPSDRSGYCCWTRIAKMKCTSQIHLMTPPGVRVNFFSSHDGSPYWHMQKDPMRKCNLEKALKDKPEDYQRLLPFKFAFDLSVPAPHELGRSQFVAMEMFDLGHVPIMFDRWNYGNNAIWLPSPKWMEKKKFEIDIKLCREIIKDQTRSKYSRWHDQIVMHNRKFLTRFHSPKNVLPGWLRFLSGE